MGNKFGRSYTLSVQGEDGAVLPIKYPMTCEFFVQRANLSSLGTAMFKVHNLAEQTRNRIYKDAFAMWIYPTLEFHAGYGGNESLIFKGTVKQGCSYREEGSPNFITQVDGYMGSVATVNNQVSQSIAGPVSQLQVIDTLISRLKPLQKGYVSPKFQTIYPRGRSLCDNAWNLLLKETGNHAFIDNGRIYCMKEGDVLPTDTYVISAKTGLLGSPKRSKIVVLAEIMFEPQLFIGQQVELQSVDNSFLNNIYTIQGIEHYGTISATLGGKARTRVMMFIGSTALFPALGTTRALI